MLAESLQPFQRSYNLFRFPSTNYHLKQTYEMSYVPVIMPLEIKLSPKDKPRIPDLYQTPRRFSSELTLSQLSLMGEHVRALLSLHEHRYNLWASMRIAQNRESIQKTTMTFLDLLPTFYKTYSLEKSIDQL